jgi:hypothetical protein
MLPHMLSHIPEYSILKSSYYISNVLTLLNKQFVFVAKILSFVMQKVVNVSFSRISSLSKIWVFHGGDYEEWCLLRYYAVWLL